jgi:hypothetical protein
MLSHCGIQSSVADTVGLLFSFEDRHARKVVLPFPSVKLSPWPLTGASSPKAMLEKIESHNHPELSSVQRIEI